MIRTAEEASIDQSQLNEGTFRMMRNHKRFVNFMLYSTSYILFGTIWTSLGPLFPFLAEKEGRLETQYSFFFTCRAFGFVTGALVVSRLTGKFSLHSFIVGGVGFMGFFSALFYFTDSLWLRGLFVFMGAMGCACQDITINMAVLQSFKGQHSALWLQIIHACFGCGGLLGPFFVYVFQLQTLTVLGIASLAVIIFYFKIPSPQNKQEHEQLTFQKEQDKMHLSKFSIFLIAGAFFFTVGQQSAYGGWISSYAVLNNFSSKQHATFYSSLYWVSITFFRFALALVPGSSSRKIEYFALSGVFGSVLGYFIIYSIEPQFGINFMSIIYGFCNSVIYALLLTVPNQFGFRLTMQETTTFVTWASLGQGCLAVGIGELMGRFSYNWLIYGMFFMDFAIYLLVRANKFEMVRQKQKQTQTKAIQMKLLTQQNKLTASTQKIPEIYNQILK